MYTSGTVGKNDGTINNGLDGTSDKPFIHGGVYALYGSSINFYDGILEGGVAAHYDRNIKAIADNANIFYTQSEVDGETFKQAYLIAEQDIAKIGTAADAPRYKSLDAAFSAAQAGDTIYLLRDAYTYKTIRINSDRDFTLDLDGHNIIAANHIDNYGHVVIKNSNQTIEYHEGDYFIVNHDSGNIELNGLNIKANRIADNEGGTISFVNSTLTNYTELYDSNIHLIYNNGGTLNLTGTNVTFTNPASVFYISSGGFNITNSTIRAANGIYVYQHTIDSTVKNSTVETLADYNATVIYVNGGTAKLSITDNSQMLGNIFTNGQKLLVKDTTFEEVSMRNETNINVANNCAAEFDNITVRHTQYGSYYDGGEKSTFRNSGTATIKNSNIEQLFSDRQGIMIWNQARVITNTGTLSIDGTAIKQNDYPSNEYSSIAVYNSGTFDMLNSTVTTARNLTSAYGFYNDGTATIDKSTVTVTGLNAYGVYANNGELTLGEAEPELLPDGTHNPRYGRSDANVSTSTPLISAIGTNKGVAATINAGKLNFYDGKLYQNNPNGPALQPDESPVALTKVEYLYQAETYEDIYNNYYFILEFMRNP